MINGVNPMSVLFSPLSFAGLTLRNRIVMPPMATAFAEPGGSLKDDGIPGEATIAHYAKRAANGVGMVIVEHAYASRQGKAHRGQLGIDTDEAVPGFKALAAAIRRGGAVTVLQINHVGAAGNPDVTGHDPLGPSDVPMPKQERRPVPMTRDHIAETAGDFALAARRAREAGFQAVEIHAAHGYLLTQFLSPITNRRTDEYGGSLENRARFLLQIVEAVRKQASEDFPVFVRLGSVDGFEGDSGSTGGSAGTGGTVGIGSTAGTGGTERGIAPEDAARVACLLEDAGVGLIDVSGGFIGSRPKGAGPGYFVPAASTIKSRVNIPVLVTGGITDFHLAESILREGKADLVGVGRALLQDPEWALKAQEFCRCAPGTSDCT